MYVYVQSEKAGSDGEHRWDDLFTVGFYKPDGKWEAESDHGSKEAAAERVAWLNGDSAVARVDRLLGVIHNK